MTDRVANTAALGTLIWVGVSPALQLARTQVWEAATTDLPVLVVGEPGTGRQLAARTLHALSPRQDQPFVRACCSALHPDQASEILFGGDRPGALEQASNGTLFLDEVETLPEPQQQLLLSHLPRPSELEGGGTRIVAACSPDPERHVRAGTLLAQLYYRLAIVPVRLPALRFRPGDLPILATHFARQAAERLAQPAPVLDPAALRVLADHRWPGNVWELKRLMERATVLTGDRPITPANLTRLLQAAPWNREPQPRPFPTWTPRPYRRTEPN